MQKSQKPPQPQNPPKQICRILKTAFPLMLANITIPLLGAVDTAVLGRLGDVAYLAAMAVGTTIFGYFFFGFNFLRTGTAGLSAQAEGARDYDEGMRILYRALITAFVIGMALLTVFNLPILRLAHAFFDVSEKVEGFVNEYYSIRILAAPASLANLVFIGWFLGKARTFMTLLIQAFINLLNIVLDIWLVLGLGFAIKGAAWATVIAEYSGLALGLCLAFGWLGRAHTKQTLAAILHRADFHRLLALNFNVMIRTFLLLTCFAWFTAVGAKLGTSVLAVNAVLMNFLLFAGYALDGIADATQALSGQEAGRKNAHGLKQLIRSAFLTNGIIALCASGIYWLAFDSIVAILTDLAEIKTLAAHYTIWAILTPVTGVWCFLLDGIFLGLTLGRRLRDAMIVSTIGFFIIVTIAVNLQDNPLYSNHALWFSMHAFFIIRALSLWWLYPKQAI